MAYTDLLDFIHVLEKKGELKRIRFEVDPILEIAEFADRSVKTQGPALLFEKPKGSRIPVLINAFASMLLQTERFGTPIARALSTFADRSLIVPTGRRRVGGAGRHGFHEQWPNL